MYVKKSDDLDVPKIEIFPNINGSRFDESQRHGLPILILVRRAEDLYRRDIKDDDPRKGWYLLDPMTDYQSLREHFEGYVIQYFILPVQSDKYRPLKPDGSLALERSIQEDLNDQDIPYGILKALLGYIPGEVPFIYAGARSVASSDQGQVLVDLWVGMSCPIDQLRGEFVDQSYDVLVQWWGHTYVNHPEHSRINRLEVHRIEGTSDHVLLQYEDVQEMGQFGGILTKISIHFDTEENWAHMGKPRSVWRIHPIRYDSDKGYWVDLYYSNVSGTTVLNGLGQLEQFHHPVKVVKDSDL